MNELKDFSDAHFMVTSFETKVANMARDPTDRQKVKTRTRRESKPKAHKFYHMSHDFTRGGAPGFELENEETLKQGRRAIGHVPWRPGFPDYPEPPRFLFDKKFGRPPRDLEQYNVYWVVSDHMKSVLETVDPDGVAFLKCDVRLRDGQRGPERWFCDVLRILDAVDEDASTIKIKYEGTRKIYSLLGSPDVVFKEDVVDPAHIFRMAYLEPEIICDDELKRACKAAGLKGILFQDALRK